MDTLRMKLVSPVSVYLDDGPLGQQVIVDNRPSGVVYAEIVAKAAPDGYTLLVSGSSVWIAPFLQDDVPYDPVRDFAPITLADRSPSLLVVLSSIPAKSVKELIALAQAKPGELSYASGPIGSANHLGAELFKSLTGVNIVRIAYKGGAPSIAGLLGGEVQLSFANSPSVMPHIKSGKLRALGVTSADPSPLFPGMPTVAATVPGYQLMSPDSVFAPAKTPAAIIKRLNQEIARVLNQPEVKAQFFENGVETVGSAPEELAAFIKADMATWGKLIKTARIRAQ